MLKNNIHTKLVSASVLGVMLFLMLFSFYYNYDFFKKSSINIIESNHASNLNFTDADDSRGFLFITEKEELEFREKDTIITLAGFCYTAFFSVLYPKQHSFFTFLQNHIVQQLLLYDVFCAWKIPSIAFFRM